MDDHSLFLELYSKTEQALLGRLEQLFRDWYARFKAAEDPAGHILRDFSAGDMCFDGFYPGYLSQRVKILFVGKESRGISGINYLECLYEAYKKKRVGGSSLNNSSFHRRMFYLSYALQTGCADYSSIPYAEELSSNFGTKQLSFAFMNLSKFSNEKLAYQADYAVIARAVELSTSGRNFIQEEILLLKPDVIFTMNLSPFLPSFGSVTPIRGPKQEDVQPCILGVGRSSFLLLDTWHFSRIMAERPKLFDPILQTLMHKEVRKAVRGVPIRGRRAIPTAPP